MENSEIIVYFNDFVSEYILCFKTRIYIILSVLIVTLYTCISQLTYPAVTKGR